MAVPQRFSDSILTNAVLETAFAEHDFEKRMAALREKIEHIRNSWPEDERYLQIMATLKSIIKLENLKLDERQLVQTKLDRILEEFHDYADTTHRRTAMTQGQQYRAVELYCSGPGYEYIYSTIAQALRRPDVSDDILTAAVVLVELVTIDLYNLRVSNIGDTRYSNFQGIVYRCYKVSLRDVEKYKAITELPKVKDRHFSIPLGLCSSSTDENAAKSFIIKEVKPGEHAIIWKLHVHGMDPDLLHSYVARYPDSVVTSICAMPVARLSPYGEKEILLRGGFFQAIRMSDNAEEYEGRFLHRIELVTINANRDHTTERASDQGEKAVQRAMFRLIAEASRYEVSASVSEQHGLVLEAAKYKELQVQRVAQLEDIFGYPLKKNQDLAAARSRGIQTWLGGSKYNDYPVHYTQLRLAWQDAVTRRAWKAAAEILHQEYDWYKNDWFNVAKLHSSDDDNHQPERFGFTFLHEFALHKDFLANDLDGEEKNAREELMQLIAAPVVWKTVRSFDARAMTAYELAQEAGNGEAAQVLQPQIVHEISADALASLERQLHQYMHEKASAYIDKTGFRIPQVSVLTEMQSAQLWVPIPHMYGGFAIELHATDKLRVTMFETVPGHSQPRHTEAVLIA